MRINEFFVYNNSLTPDGQTDTDYFVPFYVKHRKKIETRHGVLFTCMTTRAIHVEIAHSHTTDSGIMAIRRMMSIHGQIQDII